MIMVIPTRVLVEANQVQIGPIEGCALQRSSAGRGRLHKMLRPSHLCSYFFRAYVTRDPRSWPTVRSGDSEVGSTLPPQRSRS